MCGGRLKSWGGIGVDQLSTRETDRDRERKSEMVAVCAAEKARKELRNIGLDSDSTF